MRLWRVIVFVALASAPAYAYTSECWWLAEDPSHPELSCTPLTQALLTSLEGVTKAQVVAAMGAPGLPDAGRVLRFESNYAFRRRGYSGAVVYTFTRDGHVEVINAAVDAPRHRFGMKFIWNAAVPGCSDFPGSIQRCDNVEGAPRPLQQEPQRNSAPAQNWLLAWLRRHFFSGT
jgi:hypothetical protein